MYILIIGLAVSFICVVIIKIFQSEKLNQEPEEKEVFEEYTKKTNIYTPQQKITKIDESTCYLSYVNNSKIQKYVLDEATQITIGSSPYCKVHLNSDFIDNVHVVLACDEKGWFLQSYRNNFFIHENKNKREIALNETTYFTVGNTKIKFVKAQKNQTKIYGI